MDILPIKLIQYSTYSIEKDKSNNEIVTLMGTVKMQDENFHLINADKVVIDKAKKLVTVLGNYEFTFKGSINYFQRLNDTTRRIEYTLGKNILFIK